MPIIERVGPPLVRAVIRHLPPRGRGIRLAHGLKRRLPLTNPARLSNEPSGMKLRCDLRDELSFVIYYRGWVDQSLEAWMRKWLRPGDLYIDVGSHIGYLVSLAVRCVGREGRIEAFEPNPETFGKLEAAVRDLDGKRAPSITLHNAAVGAEPGEATIHVPAGAQAHQSYRASLAGGDDRIAAATVPIVRLDDLAGHHVRLLKIDTEGFEVQVLNGARRLLEACDAVLIEINPEALSSVGSRPEQVIAALAGHGFRAHTPMLDGQLRPLAPTVFAQEFEDVVFIR